MDLEDGYCNIGVYATKADADAMVATCRAYAATRYDLREIKDSTKAYAAFKRWARRHPGGEEAANYGYFDVVAIPFHSAGDRP